MALLQLLPGRSDGNVVSHARPLFFRIEVWCSSYTRLVLFPKNRGERLVLTRVQCG